MRVFVLVVLALGLVLKPMLASMGELHELAHHSAESHAPAGHVNHADDDVHDPDPQDEDAPDTLHALIHFAHCCGQSPLASSPALAFVAGTPLSDVLLMPEPQVLSHALLLAPFRPPITA